jgi:hypothetical protein
MQLLRTQIQELKQNNQNNITTDIIDNLIKTETEKARKHYEENRETIAEAIDEIKKKEIVYTNLNETYKEKNDNVKDKVLSSRELLHMGKEDYPILETAQEYLRRKKLIKSKPGEMEGVYGERALGLTSSDLPGLRTLRKGGKRRQQKTRRRRNKKSRKKRR